MPAPTWVYVHDIAIARDEEGYAEVFRCDGVKLFTTRSSDEVIYEILSVANQAHKIGWQTGHESCAREIRQILGINSP